MEICLNYQIDVVNKSEKLTYNNRSSNYESEKELVLVTDVAQFPIYVMGRKLFYTPWKNLVSKANYGNWYIENNQFC